MSPVASRRWRCASDRPMPFRQWDGEYVVFNPLSGNTHILDVVSGETLLALVDGPADEHALCARIARFLDVREDEILRQNVAHVLDALDEVGLVEPVPGC